ncbi:M15 family metallopeptidase [Roseateles sp.]|uniref:M15 family metallopeptidase n=1 Tax=Roseateles sp. TaxID=1971397 RepID=UPI003BA88AA9
MPTISASVGQGGVNRRDDVLLVQQLLVARGYTAIGTPSGTCDAKTIAALREYQSGFLSSPDGRVDPGGNTWRHLAASFGPPLPAVPGPSPAPAPAAGADLLRPVPRPDPATLNAGLTSAGNSFMLSALGTPLVAGGYSSLCQMPTLPKLRRNLVTDTVGPFRVTGLVPAVLSLKAVMADIRAEQPAAYAVLGTAGMLCCRLVRGSATAISNHSWGTAIDLTLNGVLDVQGDDKVQYGLTLIAPLFNRHGWFWGAAFGVEDAMHFEAGKGLVSQWAAALP